MDIASVNSKKTLKYFALIFRGNSNPVVFHFNTEGMFFVIGANNYYRLVVIVFDGIIDEIIYHIDKVKLVSMKMKLGCI